MSELIWIAVPNGIRGSDAMLRLLVIPRLTGTSLTEAGMALWPPPELAAATLVVEFADEGSPVDIVATVDINPPHLQSQADVWEAFFRDITVTPTSQQRQRGAIPIEVSRTTEVAQQVDATYRAAASTDVDDAAPSQQAFEATFHDQLRRRWSDRPLSATNAPSAAERLPPEPPDFHRTLAMLREHPNVLRALGLVGEFALPIARLPSGLPGPMLRVLSKSEIAGLPTLVSPWTRFGQEFRPASVTGISGGMVTLTNDDGTSDGRWQVMTVDADNAAERLRQAASKLLTGDGGPAAEGPGILFPALRSAGLLLARSGRHDEFEERRRLANSNASRSSLQGAILSADQLTLGYRLDVRDAEAKLWLSLHERNATYWVRNGGDEIVLNSGNAVEEGHVKPNAAVDDGSGALRADEVLARWDGWGLSLQRPPFDRLPGQSVRTRRVDNTPYRFTWKFDPVPGRLPRLRFSRTYRLRARIADLAGGGLTVEDPQADRCFTEGVQYLRYEPIAPPELALPDHRTNESKLGPSEAIQHVVIRSDRDIHSSLFAAENPRYTVNHARELHPPRTSLALAEQHGAVDTLDPADAWGRIQRTVGAEASETGAAPAVVDFAGAGIRVFPKTESGSPAAPSSDRPWVGEWPEVRSKRLELRQSAGTDAGAVFWEQVGGEGGANLVVSLRPAELLTVDLSSFPKADVVGHLAVQPNLTEMSRGAVNGGRHPLVSPPSAVTFVHAVKKPLSDPSGRLSPVRQEGETFANLKPIPEFLAVDALSTGQLDITATWTEPVDDQTEAHSDIHVQSLIIGRGDTAFRDRIRHEFGDTKHRNVTYEATAVSRFRGYFHADEPEAAFLARGDTIGAVPVNIPNTARPTVPNVTAVRPAFEWMEERETGASSTRITRRRLGGRLRLELERPWFATGEGEALAVIVSTMGIAESGMSGFLTQAGRDPIWDTGAPFQWLRATDLAGASGSSGNLRLLEAPQPVVAVPFAPWFHNNKWYVDISLPGPTRSSYCPFVQLAVARYQPESLHDERLDIRLSPVVKTEIVQLFPDRELSVIRSGDHVEVSIGGIGPDGPRRNRVDLVVEQLQGPAGGQAAPAGITSFAPSESIGGWTAFATFSSQLQPGAEPMTISLPPGNPRIRVREVELIGSNDSDFSSAAGTPNELHERTIFTDVVVL